MLHKIIRFVEKYGPPLIAFAIVGFAADAGKMLYQRRVVSAPVVVDEVVNDVPPADPANTASTESVQQQQDISRAPASVYQAPSDTNSAAAANRGAGYSADALPPQSYTAPQPPQGFANYGPAFFGGPGVSAAAGSGQGGPVYSRGVASVGGTSDYPVSPTCAGCTGPNNPNLPNGPNGPTILPGGGAGGNSGTSTPTTTTQSSLPVSPGFAFNCGGGIVTGTGVQARVSMCEPVSANLQKGTNVIVLTGIQGVLF